MVSVTEGGDRFEGWGRDPEHDGSTSPVDHLSVAEKQGVGPFVAVIGRAERGVQPARRSAD